MVRIKKNSKSKIRPEYFIYLLNKKINIYIGAPNPYLVNVGRLSFEDFLGLLVGGLNDFLGSLSIIILYILCYI